jgi:hypothetical protein
MKNIKAIIVLLLLQAVSMGVFSQDKILKSKQEVLKGSKSSGSQRQHSSSSGSASWGNEMFGNAFAEVVVQGLLFVTYYAAIGNYIGEEHLHNNLTRYPYCNTFSGNYVSTDSDPASSKILRFDFEALFLYSNRDLLGNHLKLKIRPVKYFYLQGDFFQFTENSTINRNQSTLSLFNFNLCYDRIRFENFNLGWTLGASYLGNNVRKAGFSYGLNTDIFISKNVSLFSSMKWSSINNAPVNELEFQCRYHRRNYFFTVGYEHLKIAAPTYDFISAGGGFYL